jgi:toxin HigB-1
MTISFGDLYLKELFQGTEIGKPQFEHSVILSYKRKIKTLQFLENLKAISRVKGLNLEALKGNRTGLYSVRVDKKYRIIFRISPENILIAEELIILELSNHYK